MPASNAHLGFASFLPKQCHVGVGARARAGGRQRRPVHISRFPTRCPPGRTRARRRTSRPACASWPRRTARTCCSSATRTRRACARPSQPAPRRTWRTTRPALPSSYPTSTSAWSRPPPTRCPRATPAAPSSGGGAGAGVGRRASVGRLDAEQGRRASSARLPPAQPAALRYLRPPRQAAVIRRPRCTAQPQGLSKDAVPVCPVCKRRRFMQCVRAAARCTPGPSRVSWVAAGPQPPSAPRPRLHAQRLNFTTEDDLAYGGSSI